MHKLITYWQENTKFRLYFGIFIACFAILGVVTLASPFSPLQSVFGLGDDFGIYATYSDFIRRGELPHRDFFDMKGPIWMYWWGLIGLLYPGDVFRGMFLVQCSLALVNFFLLRQILVSVRVQEKYRLVLALLATVLVYLGLPPQPIAPALGSIGSLLLTCTLGCVLLAQNWTKLPSKSKLVASVILGLLAGVVFWCKYTDIGIFLVTLGYLGWISKRRAGDQIRLWAGFGGGFLGVCLLVAAWYAVHGAWADLIYHYFLLPFRAYGNQAGGSFVAKILKIMEQLALMWNLPANHAWSLVYLLVSVLFLTLKKCPVQFKVLLISLLVGGIVFNGVFGHFYDWFWVMGILALMLILVLDEKILQPHLPEFAAYSVICVLATAAVLSRNYQSTKDFIYAEKQDVMTAIMSYAPAPKLLALYPYSWYTFFHGTNAVNAGRYYMVPTLSRAGAPEVFSEIIEMIAKRTPDLIVTRYGSSEMQHEYAPEYEYAAYTIDNEGYFFPAALLSNYQILQRGEEFILWEQKPATSEAELGAK